MKKYEVRFDIHVPDEISIDELEDFLNFELGIGGGLSGQNPLSQTDIMGTEINNLSVSYY